MNDSRRQALQTYVNRLKPLATLVLEGGSGTVRTDMDLFARMQAANRPAVDERVTQPCIGELVCAVDGRAVLLLSGEGTSFPSSGRAYDLTLSGSHVEHGSWVVEAPLIHVRAGSRLSESTVWAIARPINTPVRVLYGDPRSAAKVVASINNLDLSMPPSGQLAVQAGAVAVGFVARPELIAVRDLVDGGLLPTATTMEFSFDSPNAATDTAILEFCADVGALCTFASGHHNGVPIVTFLDAGGRIVRRLLVNPIDTARDRYPVLTSGHTPGGFAQLFAECFEEHRRMRRSTLPWRKLPSYCASIGDGSYLEQRVAAVMTALEFFMRTSLTEADPPSASAYASKTFPDLTGAARKVLAWDIPKHYTAKDLPRLVRNAVAHGGDLPTKDIEELRRTFDKWRLFLFRRVLIRLGYKGRVSSPDRGWESSSPVDDFSEQHNDFTPH